MNDHIIAWFGRLGTEWRRKDNRSPADMTTPTEYAPVRSFHVGPIGPGEVTGPVYVNSIPYVPASEVERLRAALQFYADPANWIDAKWDDGSLDGCITPNAIPAVTQEGAWVCDCGDAARKVLES